MQLFKRAGCPPEWSSGTLTSLEGVDRSGSQGGGCGLLLQSCKEEMVRGRVGRLIWEALCPQGLAAIPVAHGHHCQWFLRLGVADSWLCFQNWKSGDDYNQNHLGSATIGSALSGFSVRTKFCK